MATGQQGVTEWYDTLQGVVSDPSSSNISGWDAGPTEFFFPGRKATITTQSAKYCVAFQHSIS